MTQSLNLLFCFSTRNAFAVARFPLLSCIEYLLLVNSTSRRYIFRGFSEAAHCETFVFLFRQLINAYADESATEDALYFLGEALRRWKCVFYFSCVFVPWYQCWGSGSAGSACFWASRIRIRTHQLEVRIRLRLLPFSEIMLAKQDFNTKF